MVPLSRHPFELSNNFIDFVESVSNMLDAIGNALATCFLNPMTSIQFP